MSKATATKIQSLKSQAGGYLMLAKGHALEGNAEQASLYIMEAKRLWAWAENFIDEDQTDIIYLMEVA